MRRGAETIPVAEGSIRGCFVASYLHLKLATKWGFEQQNTTKTQVIEWFAKGKFIVCYIGLVWSGLIFKNTVYMEGPIQLVRHLHFHIGLYPLTTSSRNFLCLCRCLFVCLCLCVCVFLCHCHGWGSVDSVCRQLSENIWFDGLTVILQWFMRL